MPVLTLHGNPPVAIYGPPMATDGYKFDSFENFPSMATDGPPVAIGGKKWNLKIFSFIPKAQIQLKPKTL